MQPAALALTLCRLQPKEIAEIKDFLLTARRKDAKCAQVGCAGGGVGLAAARPGVAGGRSLAACRLGARLTPCASQR